MSGSARRRLRLVAWAAAAAAFAAVLGLGALWWIRRPALPAAARGLAVATRMGCFNCHGPGGTGGVPNPGSEEGEVPGWTGGVPGMYVQSDAEWREWILFGAPSRVRDRSAPAPAGLLRMPAYFEFVSDREVNDLVAYLKLVAALKKPTSAAAARGYVAAARLGCFGCHGPGGRIGSPNPRSLKGIIPGWEGRDFAELVRNDKELHAWILDGSIPRLSKNPVARWFTVRQRIAMPGYRDVLRPGELEALVAYIRFIRGEAGSN